MGRYEYHFLESDQTPAAFNGLAHFQQDPLDLTVILEQSGRLQRIEQNLSADIVQIPAPPVGRTECGVKRDSARKRANVFLTYQRIHHLPVAASLATDQHTGADMPVIVIDGRRVRQLQFNHLFLAHGGAPLVCGGGTEAAAAPVAPVLGA